MPISEQTRDELRALAASATALATIAMSAAENADSEDVTVDPMLQTARRQYLTVIAAGRDCLTVSSGRSTPRVSSAVLTQAISDSGGFLEPNESDIIADLQSGPDSVSLRQFQSVVNEHNPAATFSVMQELFNNSNPV